MKQAPSMLALKQIYQDYARNLAQVYAHAPMGAGLFGIGDDPRNHSCNDVFYQQVAQWVQDFLSQRPEQGVMEAAAWILFQPAENRSRPTYWFLYAAQKHAQALVPLLSRQEKAELLEQFLAVFPRREWTPVQQELYRQLSGGKPGKGSFLSRLFSK